MSEGLREGGLGVRWSSGSGQPANLLNIRISCLFLPFGRIPVFLLHKMAALSDHMPRLLIPETEITVWGTIWTGTTKGNGNPKPSNCFDKKQGMDFGTVFDRAFGQAISSMLGGIPVVRPDNDALLPPQPDCVEVGKTRIVGGIRAQNFDAAYRPDGPRIVYDSKTLNDAKSIQKNWQNMVNDLVTEASTVHTRFPYCIVAFIVLFPRPALAPNQQRNLIRTLERLGSRKDELDQTHLAEAIAMVIWDPVTGGMDPDVPAAGSVLRLDTIEERIYPHSLLSG
jgi:hypothetical protein